MSGQQSSARRRADVHGRPPSRRAQRRRLEEARPWVEPSLPVRVGARWPVLVILVVVFVVQPGRRGSLILEGLAEGPTSRKALLGYAIAILGLAFTALYARTHLSLERDATGRTVVVVQGILRRRVLVMSPGREVRVVGGPAARVLILEADGGLVVALGAGGSFWQRTDVATLLRREGVTVTHDHARPSAREIEAAHPGSTVWLERTRVRLYTMAFVVVIVLVAAMVWFIES